VYAVDILTCPRCGGVRGLLAAIQDPDSIERVLGDQMAAAGSLRGAVSLWVGFRAEWPVGSL
jgi:hypothetical protein